MAAYKLKELLERPEMLLIPGAGSPLEILLIEQAGFEAACLGGYSAAAHRYGLPDAGLIAFEEMRNLVQATCATSSIPLIVDCDTGYGGVLNVRRLIQTFEAAGVAAVEIEDQTWPKRCGLMDGLTVEPIDIAVQKIDAALSARRSDDLLVIARTDARMPLGFDEAMKRCIKYKSAGADIVLMHSPQSMEELEIFASEIPGPKVVSIGEGEPRELGSLADLFNLGYRVALFPSSILRTSIYATQKILRHLRTTGEVNSLASEMVTPEKTSEILGMNTLREFEARLSARQNIRVD